MKNIVILRGVPGSGKSTYAAKNYPSFKVFENDQFFMKDGSYQYDPKKIGEACTACQCKALLAMSKGEDVVISNTHTHLWEFFIYVNMANVFGYNMKVIHLRNRFKNVHNVPDETVQRMEYEYEPYPNETEVRNYLSEEEFATLL